MQKPSFDEKIRRRVTIGHYFTRRNPRQNSRGRTPPDSPLELPQNSRGRTPPDSPLELPALNSHRTPAAGLRRTHPLNSRSASVNSHVTYQLICLLILLRQYSFALSPQYGYNKSSYAFNLTQNR